MAHGHDGGGTRRGAREVRTLSAGYSGCRLHLGANPRISAARTGRCPAWHSSGGARDLDTREERVSSSFEESPRPPSPWSNSTGPSPVPWLSGVSPAVHGSFDRSVGEKLGIPTDTVLDFSANGNVIGPAPSVAAAIQAVDLSRYPDRESLLFRQAIAAGQQTANESVIVGNGSTELIWA